MNQKVNKSFLVYILMLCFGVSIGQIKYNFKHLGLEEGLSSSTISMILKDKNQYLWVATNNGLNHFDGHTFTKIAQGNNEGEILGSNIVTLHEMDDDHLIIGTNLGISLINIQTFETENIVIDQSQDAHYKDNYVVEVVPSTYSKGFWILTFKEILFFDTIGKKIKHRYTFPKLNSEEFTHLSSPRMAELEDGTLLFMKPQNRNYNFMVWVLN